MIDYVKRILNRRNAYRRLFLDEDGNLSRDAETIIKDLTKFCRLHQSTTVVSDRKTDVPASFQAEGRREVILRILSHIHATDADLFRITQEVETDE